MNQTPSKPANDPTQTSVDDLPNLPPVAAPNASFILQLFLIPMIIVSIIVVVWLMFSWIANTGNDPQKLVAGLHEGSSVGWQNASSLVNLLRNPHYDHLKDDKKLAMSVAEKLNEQLASPLKEKTETRQEQLKLRVFTARLLGEFRVPDVLPTLLKAATQENDADEIAVRRSALEGIAVLIENVSTERLNEVDELHDVLKESSREFTDDAGRQREHAAMRSTAAFVLGVLGTEEARDRLAELIDDPDSNTRYNAGVALARLGDPRCVEVLVEMLDPDNEQAIAGEELPEGKKFKRILVMTNAARASEILFEQTKERSEATNELETALKIAASSSQRAAATAAKSALQKLPK